MKRIKEFVVEYFVRLVLTVLAVGVLVAVGVGIGGLIQATMLEPVEKTDPTENCLLYSKDIALACFGTGGDSGACAILYRMSHEACEGPSRKKFGPGAFNGMLF